MDQLIRFGKDVVNGWLDAGAFTLAASLAYYAIFSIALLVLRHSHASALIASGLDVLTVSRRLGHGSPVVTLNTYAHLFAKTDEKAAEAIEAALRTTGER